MPHALTPPPHLHFPKPPPRAPLSFNAGRRRSSPTASPRPFPYSSLRYKRVAPYPLQPAPVLLSSTPPQHRRTEEAKPELRHRPDLLLRRIFLQSKPLSEFLVFPSFFWSLSREFWCTGAPF
jgi:hypothetical protein